MTEEFDALHSFDFAAILQTVLILLLLALLLEGAIRLVRRWATNKELPFLTAGVNAFIWQPLFLSLLFGIGLPFVGRANNPILRQQRVELLSALLLISISIIVVRITAGWLQVFATRSLPASVSVFNRLIDGLAITIIVLIALSAFGAPASVILVTIAGSSVGMGLAFNEPLSNLFSGIQLTASRRLNPGDFVRLPSGKEGYITDIEWDVTTVRQIEDNLVIVPNSIMVRAEIINYQLPDPELFVEVEVGVSYDSDLDVVEQVTLEVAKETMQNVNMGRSSAEPYLRFTSFADSSVNFSVFMQSRQIAHRRQIRHDFIMRLHRRYAAEGIVIPYPIRTLQTAPGTQLAVNQAPPPLDA